MNDVPTPPPSDRPRRPRGTIRSDDPAAVLAALHARRRGMHDLALLAQRARARSITPNDAQTDRDAWALVALTAVVALLDAARGHVARFADDAVTLGADPGAVAAAIAAVPAASTADPTTGPGALNERAPRSVRAPYDVGGDPFGHLATSDVEAWRRARALDKRAALGEPLQGLPLTDHEDRYLTHRAGDDIGETGTLAALLWRARQAGPVATWSASGSS